MVKLAYFLSLGITFNKNKILNSIKKLGGLNETYLLNNFFCFFSTQYSTFPIIKHKI